MAKRTPFSIKPGPGGLTGQAAKFGQISRGTFPGQGETRANDAGGGFPGSLADNGPDFGPCDADYGDSSIESWDCYDVSSDATGDDLSAHQGWTGGWVFKADERALYTDDFESYDVEDPVTAELNGGSANWTDPYTINNRD